jgi:hypothetical protein
MPSATTYGDSNGNDHANGYTNGISGSLSQGLDLTVLGLNSGTSIVIMLYTYKASET